ncbi:ATP-dependent helicase HrpB [Leucobacter sp. UCMA 4100]|uniref:ATP-dependent helicase HrpB n=1 Tax=Leucobacter sp. UCMA 4100 TaxID=2810534 RepID=UPI0022EB0208|nr:ATP-dependent helicase HrpB [Leucobacter sp. UCMA 4100]MDA3145962.1 ATP-dependent helicase HrpB [Leucobacter sp. UCMA 4100]
MHLFDLERIGSGLPVAQHEAALTAGLATASLVVTAPPGTGKTTFVPPLTANAVAGRGTTIVTQPRRVAVRAAAHRIASLDRSDVGETVGFTVRGERRVGPDTRIEVVTPGVLLRRLISDPALDGVAAVVLDEVHERSLDGDLLLGLIAEVRQLRDDLTVVAMSATLDAGQVAKVIEAEVVDIPSALHPLTVTHRPHSGPRLDHRGVTNDYLDHLARVAVAEHQAHGSDALVFVPGAREVEGVARRIEALQHESDVLMLHGQLGARHQDQAVRGRAPGERPRIVVSTALAESSLTVPGIHLVVDSGLSREVRRDAGRDMTGLVTVSASRSSAEQRAGRAARLGPGRAVRAFSEQEFAHMPAHAQPEILSADLTDAALLLAAWGSPDLPLITAPPTAALARAERTLLTLGLITETGDITPEGSRIALLPVGAREARALLAGAGLTGSPQRAAEVIAAIAGGHREASTDAGKLLRDLRSGAHPGARSWKREVRRLEAIAREHPAPAPGGASPDADTEVAAIIALARPEWVARRTAPHSRSYLFASGSRAALPENSPLREHEWIAVHEVQRAEGRVADGTGAVIRLAAPLTEQLALTLSAALLAEQRKATIDDGRVRVREERLLGAIRLSSQPVKATAADTAGALLSHVTENGLQVLDWSEDAKALRGRLAILHRELGSPWPAVDEASLLHSATEWLMPDLEALTPGASLTSIDIEAALRRLLPWPEAAQLDALAPAALAVPSGSRVRIDYPLDDGPPVVAVKLQELFGLERSPRLVGGRVAILFHLLSPARKPLAVTDDLSSFWNGPYQDVRKEMRGRYPKHPWPEDPWSAEATKRTKRADAARRGH